jgi:hypothetical protein
VSNSRVDLVADAKLTLILTAPKYENPSHGGPRSTYQLQSLICSTIATATMSRSVSVRGRRVLPILKVNAKRTSRRGSSATVGPHQS